MATTILGVKVNDRIEHATELQTILTKNGCDIKTRIGLHTTGTDFCSPFGIILLEITEEDAALGIEKELLEIDEIEIQRMVF